MKMIFASLAAILFAVSGVVHAQDAQQNEPPAPQQDQAAPEVGHISFIHGQVSTQRGDSAEWVAATVNTPVMPGDKVSTAGGSRAEVQLDYANVIRLDQNSLANVTNLTRDQIQVQVAQGLVNYDVLRANGPSAEIDTPNMAVHPLQPGSYRIEVVSNGETRVTVRSGEAQISTPQGSTNVEAGQITTVEGTDNPQYQTASAPREDDWDRWNRDRDSRILHAESWRHTDAYYTGSADLDAYGHWQYVPDYGSVWVPVEEPGWAPYRDGRWVWEPYYGWSWVSYEPWGWAPYHYGRWFVYDNDWCWWPGPVVAYPAYYPIWAPAYVSFFGFGGAGWSVGFGFGFGSIGWLPIGPGDYFCPWWGRFGNQVNIVNITNITNITNIRNRFNEGGLRPIPPLFHNGNIRGFSNLGHAINDPRVRAGISSMGAKEFGRSAVPRGQRLIQPAALQNARMFTGRVPAVPTRQSLQSVDRAAARATIRAGAANQHFFGRTQTSFTPRPFNQSVQANERVIQSYRSQPFTSRGATNATARNSGNSGGYNDFTRPGTAARSSASAFSGRSNPAVRPSIATPPPSSSQPGWQKFGQSGSERPSPGFQGNRGSTARPGPPAQPTVRPGWQRFGQNGAGRASPSTQPQARPQPNRTFTPRPSSPASRGPGWSSFSRPNENAGGPGRSQPSRNTPNQFRSVPGSGLRQQVPNRGRGGWQTFSQPSRQPNDGGSRSFNRQPLNLSHPIVNQRSYSPFGEAPRGYSNGGRAPAYDRAPSDRGSGGYSYGGRAPSYEPAPSYSGRAPSYGGDRGGYSYGGRAPSFGGGRGGYSAPRGGESGSRGGGARPGGGSRGGGGGHPHH